MRNVVNGVTIFTKLNSFAGDFRWASIETWISRYELKKQFFITVIREL